jgi:Ca2+-binding RTX toxin-like protein
VSGGSTASLSLQLNDGTNDVTLTGWNASASSGIRSSSVLSFDDGSVLRTNSSAVAASLSGGTGNDLLVAGSGGDRLLGNAGNDRLIGGSGADQLYGGNGDDVIYGGNGSDYLVGGSGTDTFVMNGNAGNHQTIADFEDGVDIILIDTGDATALMAGITVADSNGDALVTFTNGSTIRLLGVSNADITDADFSYSGGSFFAAGTNVFA